ncbi:MAG TPA: hypothetical protein VFN97_20950, partial [Actinospica sp.]|nr:hypothetical protein [Actinospica sp.]
MSLTTMRGAIAAYLQTGIGGQNPIPTLQQVYRAMPTWIDPKRWWQVPQDFPAGTVAFLHIAKRAEDRDSLPAIDGSKMIAYTVTIVLIYKYIVPTDSQATALEGDEWVDGLDECVEGICALIRADPNLGTAPVLLFSDPEVPGVIYDRFPGAVWQAGQDPGDLQLTADLPALDEDTPGELLAFQMLDFHAYEVITA